MLSLLPVSALLLILNIRLVLFLLKYVLYLTPDRGFTRLTISFMPLVEEVVLLQSKNWLVATIVVAVLRASPKLSEPTWCPVRESTSILRSKNPSVPMSKFSCLHDHRFR